MTRNQRGSVAVEFAVVLPLLILLIGLVAGGGRLAHARATVLHLADTGARAASLARDPGTARADALAVIGSDAAAAGLRCGGGMATAVDTSGFAVAVGSAASVGVEVTCQVTLSDLLLPGLPGAVAVRAASASSLDRHRGR